MGLSVILKLNVPIYNNFMGREREGVRDRAHAPASLLGVLSERMRTKCSEKLDTVMAHQCLLNYR